MDLSKIPLSLKSKKLDAPLPQHLTGQHMILLWEKMTRIYGRKWSSIAESDDGTWLQGLRGITPENLSKGLGGIINSGNAWPPSLPEFKRMCVGVDERDLEKYIREVALLKYDSFSINGLSERKIESLIGSVRTKATDEYIHHELCRINNQEIPCIAQNVER